MALTVGKICGIAEKLSTPDCIGFVSFEVYFGMNIQQNLKSISFVVLPAWKLYTTETKYQNKQTKNVEEIQFQFSFLSLFVTFSFGLSIVRLSYLTFISFRLMFSYSNSNINGKDQNQFDEATLKRKNSELLQNCDFCHANLNSSYQFVRQLAFQ